VFIPLKGVLCSKTRPRNKKGGIHRPPRTKLSYRYSASYHKADESWTRFIENMVAK